MIGAAGDDAKVTAGLRERDRLDMGLFGRLLDIADALGAMGEASLRNRCARWRGSVSGFAGFGLRASAPSSLRALATVERA